ncbi:eCIS core domain-containing protein [Streptomyces sp. CA-106110]|uniref:eCIS core domain-containing protein n=1 Tax=Streptomyces sp. CA-106110 TaxID=3240044 RepID=UPI003D943550
MTRDHLAMDTSAQREPKAKPVSRAVGAKGWTPGGPVDRAGVTALQRAVGNAVVARLVEEQWHAHGPGCGHTDGTVQRSAVHEVLRGAGQPMGGALQQEMESRFGGADFSDVRLHTGAQARRSAEEVGARAYTSGSSIVIGDGGADKHTLAHELGHVLQQRQGPVGGEADPRGLRISKPTDPLEVAAERQAHEVMRGQVPVLRKADSDTPVPQEAAASSTVPAVQRAPLHVTHEGDETTGLQAVDSDNKQDVRRFVFDSILDGNHEAVSLVMNRLKALDPQPTYLANLREEVSQGPAQERRPLIPPLVHFIWIGGGISKDALDNVLAWAEKAQNSDWRINLWTDKRSTWSWADKLRVKVAKAIEFKYIEDALDERVAATYEKATKGPAKAYPLASDIARYSILKKLGGVYADVDLGSGTIDLKQTRPTLRENDVPVLGPLIRDKGSLNASLSAAGAPPVTGVATAEQVRTAARYLLGTGGYGNHFIGAQRNSAVMEKMIDKIARSIGDMDAEELHMAGPVATGPFALIQVVDQHLSSEFGVQSLQAGEHQLFQQAGQQFHDHMQWLTAESENQNY